MGASGAAAGLAAIVTSFAPVTALAIERERSGFDSRYNTYAHSFLDAEHLQGFEVTQENYDFLDSVIHEIRTKYKAEIASPERVSLGSRLGEEGVDSAFSSEMIETYDLDDIRKIMGWIDEALSDIFNVVYKENNRLGSAFTKQEGEIVEYLKDEGNAQKIIDFEGDEFTEASEEVNDFINDHILRTQSPSGYFSFLSEYRRGSRRRKIEKYSQGFYQMDCDNMSMIYLAIGQVLNFPIEAVLGPEHMFVRWGKFDGSHVNWETTAGIARSDEEYIEEFGLGRDELERGGYMKGLNKKQIAGIMYGNLGYEWIVRSDIAEEGEKEQCMEKASDCLNRASSLFPNCMYIRTNSFGARREVGDWKGAIVDGYYLLAFDPNNHDARFGVAYANGELGNKEDALRHYKILIEVRNELEEGTQKAVYNNAAVAAVSLEEYDLAIECRFEQLKLEPDDYDAISGLGYAYLKKGDNENAFEQYSIVIDKAEDVSDEFLATCYNNRGCALERMDRQDEANRDFAKSEQLKK